MKKLKLKILKNLNNYKKKKFLNYNKIKIKNKIINKNRKNNKK